MIDIKTLENELRNEVSRQRLEEICVWALANGQKDVYMRTIGVLDDFPTAKSFELGLYRPFLPTLRCDYNQAFDSFDPNDLPKGLAKPEAMDLSELYETINNKILKSIEDHKSIPWNKPWVKPSKIEGDVEYNMYLSYATNKPYSILNQLMIDDQLKQPVSNPFFITPNTIKRKRGKLKKTAKQITLFVAGVMWVFENDDDKYITYSENKMRAWLTDNFQYKGGVLESTINDCFRRFLTTTQVYSADDVTGIKFNFDNRDYIPGRKNQWENSIEVADAMVESRPSPRVKIIHEAQDQAYYTRREDKVVMPKKEQFPEAARYYATLFHEIIHSTGSSKRLHRVMGAKQFDPQYNKEELVAEIGASYLTAEAGILNFHIEHTADYLKSFIDGLKRQIGEDPETLVTAFANAQRAAEYFLQRNTNGTPKYVDLVLQAQAKRRKEEKAKVKKVDTKNNSTQAKKKRPKSRKRKPATKREAILKEIQALQSKPTGKLKKRQLNLFEVISEPGLAAPEDIVSNKLKYQETVIKLKYGLKVPERMIKVGEVSDTLSDHTDRKLIKIPKAVLANIIDQDPKGPSFYNLIDLSKSINNADAIIRTSANILWVGMDLIDFSGGTYKAIVELVERKDGVVIHEIFKKLKLSEFKHLQAMAESDAKLLQENSKKKKEALANPVEHEEETFAEIVDIVKDVFEDTADIVVMKPENNSRVESVNSNLPKDVAKLFDNGASDVEIDTFTLPGEIGKLLGELQAFKLAIQITGDPHAGKTEFLTQLADAIIENGDSLAYLDLEQGGLQSKDTQAAFDRNIALERQRKIQVMGEAPEGITTVQKVAPHFDWVIIDSFQELNAHVKEFNKLRKQFPKTRFVFIFQQNADGKARGGVKTDYDANVRLKVFKVDNTFVNNYVEVLKNRGNTIGLRYNVSQRKMIHDDAEMQSEDNNDNKSSSQYENSDWSNQPLLLN
ncbi:zincin-like metallopeptidase domain-containing protein [Nonlabens xiamenensis]|uniref:zincin-like metallopeptidase domain-containing protein n=1 Tax=Nonlabens xiamenensis TaxID=2341043 RepID=UPI000F604652|nr:zincin-like metallopeptidase domain-containing protein [Nonlabens xiamenensis]